MTATERPSLEARARKWLQQNTPNEMYLQDWLPRELTLLLESVQSEERAFADTRLQTAVTTMEQATQAMLEAQAEVVELRAALERVQSLADTTLANTEPYRPAMQLVSYAAHRAIARPQPEVVLRVLRAAVAMDEGWKAWETADAVHSSIAAFTKSKAAYDVFRVAVRALPEGVREVLK